jgi:hypothetical protein
MTRRDLSGEDVDGVDAGDTIVDVDGVPVRESSWAGEYYCAHVLWTSTEHALRESTSIARDSNGDPLVGFIHVPADAEALGEAGADRRGRDRHDKTSRVLAWALRGVLDELALAEPRRILVTGFGPFGAVLSNPTGDLVGDATLMREAWERVVGAHGDVEEIEAGGRKLHIHHDASGTVQLGRLVLDVDDTSIHPAKPGSLPWAIERFAPHAVVALGVHRVSNAYRVETEATTAGLRVDGEAPMHERGRAPDRRAAINRSLARAIARGKARLG